MKKFPKVFKFCGDFGKHVNILRTANFYNFDVFIHVTGMKFPITVYFKDSDPGVIYAKYDSIIRKTKCDESEKYNLIKGIRIVTAKVVRAVLAALKAIGKMDYDQVSKFYNEINEAHKNIISQIEYMKKGKTETDAKGN